MMDDKDIQEYHNIGKPIKLNNKYQYVRGRQIDEHGFGTRERGRVPWHMQQFVNNNLQPIPYV